MSGGKSMLRRGKASLFVQVLCGSYTDAVQCASQKCKVYEMEVKQTTMPNFSQLFSNMYVCISYMGSDVEGPILHLIHECTTINRSYHEHNCLILLHVFHVVNHSAASLVAHGISHKSVISRLDYANYLPTYMQQHLPSYDGWQACLTSDLTQQ